jgi:hypothetical protein
MNDRGSDNEPFSFVCGQRFRNIIGMFRKSFDQYSGVACGFGHSHADMRPCNEGSITKDCDPGPKFHSGRLQIDDCLQERMGGSVYDLGELRSEQPIGIGPH